MSEPTDTALSRALAALAWIEDRTKHAPPGSFTALIHTKAKEGRA